MLVDKHVFAERLRVALDNRGMIQEELASKLEVDAGTISNYIKGKYAPRPERIRKIAQILEVSEGWLTGAIDQIDHPLQFVGKSPEIGIDESLLYKTIFKRQKEIFLMLGMTESDAESSTRSLFEITEQKGEHRIRNAEEIARTLVAENKQEDNDEKTQ